MVLIFAADFGRKWLFFFYIQERHIKVYLWPLSAPAFLSKLCRIYTNFIPFSCFRCFAASTKTPWSLFLLDPVLWSACGPDPGQWTVQLLGTSAATNPSTDRLITERESIWIHWTVWLCTSGHDVVKWDILSFWFKLLKIPLPQRHYIYIVLKTKRDKSCKKKWQENRSFVTMLWLFLSCIIIEMLMNCKTKTRAFSSQHTFQLLKKISIFITMKLLEWRHFLLDLDWLKIIQNPYAYRARINTTNKKNNFNI